MTYFINTIYVKMKSNFSFIFFTFQKMLYTNIISIWNELSTAEVCRNTSTVSLSCFTHSRLASSVYTVTAKIKNQWDYPVSHDPRVPITQNERLLLHMTVWSGRGLQEDRLRFNIKHKLFLSADGAAWGPLEGICVCRPWGISSPLSHTHLPYRLSGRTQFNCYKNWHINNF